MTDDAFRLEPGGRCRYAWSSREVLGTSTKMTMAVCQEAEPMGAEREGREREGREREGREREGRAREVKAHPPEMVRKSEMTK
jgi:hypothetical protein